MPVTRRKLSTTISERSYKYLVTQVEKGRATTLAEAVDHIVERALRLENRQRLEADTVAYFRNLSQPDAAEENRLESALGQTVDEVNFGS